MSYDIHYDPCKGIGHTGLWFRDQKSTILPNGEMFFLPKHKLQGRQIGPVLNLLLNLIRIIITSLIKLYKQCHSWGIIQDGQTPKAYAFEPTILKLVLIYRFLHIGGWESMLNSFRWWLQAQNNSPGQAVFIPVFLFSQTIWLFCLGCSALSSIQREHAQSSLPTHTNLPGSKVFPSLVPGLLLLFHYHKIGVIILVAITLPFFLVIS